LRRAALHSYRAQRAGACALVLLLTVTAVPALPQQTPTKTRGKYKKAKPPAPDEPARPLVPQEPLGQLDSNEVLFDVMAAINAAGYDAGLQALSNDPLRQTLRQYFAQQDLKSQDHKTIDALKRFVRDHRPRNRDTELNQYISFSLLTKGPPDFDYARPDLPLPPEVAALDGFAPLLADFYKETKLDELWNRVQPNYEERIAQYTEPVSRAILEVTAYLRSVTNNFLGKRFLIYVDLLGPPNQVQMRNYVDDYYVVITPAADFPISDIRHAFLHFMVEPQTLRLTQAMKKLAGLQEIALDSPLLEENYRTNFVDLAQECFIKAIESRIERKPAMVEQALREGFILTPAFAEQLEIYEKNDQALRIYFPELVDAITLKKEQARLAHVEFASERAVRTIHTVVEANQVETKQVEAKQVVEARQQPEISGAAKTLDEAEEAYTVRDLAKAKQAYLRVLEQTAEKPMHAKAYYGLARVAVLEKDPETGDRLFRKVLELEPDGATKSWSLLYIGRLADSQGDREEAQKQYHAALDVQDAPETVRKAAEQGIQEAFTRK
jgi:predicted negative regulator of RcsB-dependent stress response